MIYGASTQFHFQCNRISLQNALAKIKLSDKIFEGNYSGLQINSSFAFFEKISVAVDWVNIKVCLISHLKGLTATFELM